MTMRRRIKPRGETGAGLEVRWELRGGAVTGTGQAAEAAVAYVGEEATLRQAGHRMRQLGVAVLPVCGEDGRLRGIITRDMVVQSIAAGGDPKTVTVAEISGHAPVLSPAARPAAARLRPVAYGTGLRIGELADAVRAAADAVRAAADAASRLSATATGPRTPARWRPAPAAQRYGYHAA